MRYYPEPQPIEATQAPIIHCRGRVVIPCMSFEDAQELAAKVAELSACDAEGIVGVVALDDNRLLGETVFRREFYPVRIDGQVAMAFDEALTSEQDEAG